MLCCMLTGTVSMEANDGWTLLTSILTIAFFVCLGLILLPSPELFTKRHGRKHRIIGLFYLFWLCGGYISDIPFVVYDVVLGIAGIALSYTAAIEFQHKNVKNVASGTLDKHATVTHNEMIEHTFYQGINLMQIIFFHLQTIVPKSVFTSYILVFFVTSPWLARDAFPVHSFSDNYTKIDEKSTELIRVLYRIKKYQYVFYKHFLLHGLNISTALSHIAIVNDTYFRQYWLLLNTSYVMEFFLQTLVKKEYLSQTAMLLLQKILMAAATIAAVRVLGHVKIVIAIVSLLWNFRYRKHDVLNTMLLLSLVQCVRVFRPQWFEIII